MNAEKSQYLLEAKNLTMHFAAKTDSFGHTLSTIHASDDVSFRIPKAKTLGVVGESGCGKSTVGKMLLNIYKPTGGQVLYNGVDITHLSARERLPYVKKMQMVWQDPYSSLDPRLRAGDIVAEGMDNFKLSGSAAERREKVAKLFTMCGLKPEMAQNYPHQFSGGQRQRICIARALSTDPEFVVCDEAVSALDVSIQAQIINLLKDLQDELSLTYLFISHDLNIIHFISDEILVMYLGQVVEYGPMNAVYLNRAHPYTNALFAATPAFTEVEKRNKPHTLLQGDVPSPVDLKPGCRFRSRCPYAATCSADEPRWHEVEPDHFVRCNLFR
jgi:oligopeptide/dipeptide ABC transporter ATP-binding protein